MQMRSLRTASGMRCVACPISADSSTGAGSLADVVLGRCYLRLNRSFAGGESVWWPAQRTSCAPHRCPQKRPAQVEQQWGCCRGFRTIARPPGPENAGKRSRDCRSCPYQWFGNLRMPGYERVAISAEFGVYVRFPVRLGPTGHSFPAGPIRCDACARMPGPPARLPSGPRRRARVSGLKGPADSRT
jgi:hypothetical protein